MPNEYVGEFEEKPLYRATLSDREIYGNTIMDKIEKLEAEKRMWFDRYAALWEVHSVHSDGRPDVFTDGERKIFGKWAAEVDREYE